MTIGFPTKLGCMNRTPIRVRLPPSSYMMLHESRWGLASLGTALSYLVEGVSTLQAVTSCFFILSKRRKLEWDNDS